MLKSKTSAFLIILSILAIVGSFLVNSFFAHSLDDIASSTSEIFEDKLEEQKNELSNLISEKQPENSDYFFELFKARRIALYLLKHDSLYFWNNATFPVTEELNSLSEDQGFVKLKHGFYIFTKITTGDKTAIALSLVKPQFDLQNNYLHNDFSAWTKIPQHVNLNEKKSSPVVTLKGKKLFALKGEEEKYYNEKVSNTCAIIFIAGLTGLLLSLLLWLRRHNRVSSFLLIILPVILFKFIFAKRPDLFTNTFLYDLSLFANADSLLNFYLADVLFNSIALLYLAVAAHIAFTPERSSARKKIVVIILFLLVFCCGFQYNQSVKSLVTDSALSFDFLSIFNIRPAAVVALLSVVFTSLALFVCLYRVCTFFKRDQLLHFLTYCALTAVTCVLLYFVAPLGNFLQNLWLLLFAVVLYAIVRLQYQRFSLGLGIQILVMSVITSGFFNYYIDKNEKQYLEEFAYKLSERQDALLESEFASLPLKITNDEKLKVLLNFLPTSQKEVDQLLRQKYFSGYFNRYNIDFSLFDADCKPQLETQPVLLNEGFFEDQIRHNSDSTFSTELFFVEKYKKNSRYVGKITLDDKRLYVLMEPKQFEEMGSFPDLLLSQQKPEKLRNFSHAVYRSEQNTNRVGDVNYPYYFRDSVALANSNPDYAHHYFTPDESTRIVISKRLKSWNYLFTYNSYLFLFFSVVCFLCYYIYASFFTDNFKTPSLTRRIQTIVIVLLLLAMSAVGITSGRLVSKQFSGDNIKQLQEKTQIIINELNSQFKPEELFAPTQKELVNLKIKELTHLFNTDISLFDRHGSLFNTSQPRLYEKGLAAERANPNAYFSLKQNQVSAYSDTEKAGTLNYLSLYTPIYANNKELVGFLNLPYFAKQSDLVNELSGIISALINVYIILFVISILAGLILAGYITKPLRLIKQQIANITLGRQNETINWKSNDEVGKLVSEYNNMLLKLEHSANLLAQSERESAWREMAKQVAHEIKNPLTPMKLNLQYLQHLMKNNPEDFNEKFSKASASIIEQIDTLAGIATEFSNFAKLPGTQLQEINLSDIISSSVNLFEKDNATVIKNNVSMKEIIVTGDKEQALRVFNNLLKNAIQATEGREKPMIVIDGKEQTDFYEIIVRDNGTGIPNDMKERIFEPNFTTKTTGSGLGLAMVKNIMSNFGGSIRFESEENKGTSFFVSFLKPRLNP